MHRVHTETLTKKAKRQLWDEIIQDYLNSGESVRRYSEQQGLKRDHLSYYVSDYRRKHECTSSTFMSLPLPSGSAGQDRIEIRTDKFRLILPERTSGRLLETVLTTLSRLC